MIKKINLVVWLVACLLVGIAIGLSLQEYKIQNAYEAGILRAENCTYDGGTMLILRDRDVCIYD